MKIAIQSQYTLERAGIAAIIRQVWPKADVVEGATAADLGTVVDDLDKGDLLIVDWRSEVDASELAIKRKKAGEKVPVIALAENGTLAHVRHIVSHGIQAVIPVTATPDVFSAMLPFVMAGGSHVPLSVLGEAANDSPIPLQTRAAQRSPLLHEDPVFRNLTRRQREVLRLVSMGLSNEEIAEEMDVTLNTVKSHVSSMLRALGVKRRTQAMKLLGDSMQA